MFLKNPILILSLLFQFIHFDIAESQESLFDHLSGFDSLEVTISVSFKRLYKKKDIYLPARIAIAAGDNLILDTLGEIRSRGNSRKIICLMPPTKIRLDKSYLEAKGFLTYPTLKLINPCTYTSLAETYVNIENLIYEIYGLVSGKGYRTNIARFNYVDSDGRKKPVSFDGFIKEHEDQVADRMQGVILEQEYFKPQLIERTSYLKFAMFQYLIGNTDWKVLNKHNLDIIKVEQERTCYAVPYDFDYAGLVNASYAVPNEKLPIKSIRDRIYLGPCQSSDELATMRSDFLSIKKNVYGLIDHAGLQEKQHDQVADYIDKFYEILEDQRQSEKIFMHCIDY
ncbi:MAG: hypothetical protein KDC80_20320 [Saprospiraceae bacterium]|nr:hypothetical protein [Saprospiraceae bacterium]